MFGPCRSLEPRIIYRFLGFGRAARPKLNLFQIKPDSPGMRPARAGYRAVRDSTLVAWYRSLYAPRAGGAYDNHHGTTGIAGRTRRFGRIAARGARAAAGADAMHRRLMNVGDGEWSAY